MHEIRPGVYTISTTAITSYGGVAKAKKAAYDEAEKTCAGQDRRLIVINDQGDSNITNGSADVTFRCDTKEEENR